MVELIVFDIAGTTVRDNDEVLLCFRQACRQTGITAGDDALNALMGVSKLEVFHILWRAQLGDEAADVAERAEESYRVFREILEHYYLTQPVEPTEGALEVLAWCRSKGIRTALNTGFYRHVTDLILERLGWRVGETVDFVIASDEVPAGRPQPFLIQAAIRALGVSGPEAVVKIGDTPVDLAEGRNAGCLLSLGLTNGTHTHEQLAALDNDGLLPSLAALPMFLTEKGLVN